MDYLQNLTENMNARFPELITRSLKFVRFPLETYAKYCCSIALEVAKLQADNEVAVDFDVCVDLAKFWIKLPNKDVAVKNRTLCVLEPFVLFSSILNYVIS